MNPMLLRGLVLVTVALVVTIVAAALPYWWTTTPFVRSVGISTDVGLFKTCSAVKLSVQASHTEYGPKSCTENTDAASWLRGVQACVIISIILTGVSLPLLAIYCWMFTNIPTLALIAGLLNGAAGTLLELGTLLFLVMILKESGFVFGVGMPHASFYLALIAGGMLTSGGRVLYKSRLQHAGGQTLPVSGNTIIALSTVNGQPNSGQVNFALSADTPQNAVGNWTGRAPENSVPIIHPRPKYKEPSHYMNMDGTSGSVHQNQQ